MRRDELMFGTGALTALVVVTLLTLWQPPWWLTLISLPFGIFWVVQIVRGWRDEMRYGEKARNRDG